MVDSSKSYQARWSPDLVNECVELWNLSAEERGALLLLKDKIRDVSHWKNDPFEVVRFLKEFRFHLGTTEEKFRSMIRWRLEHDADRKLEDYHPPILFNYFPSAVMAGTDYDGDPVYIERTGAGDTLGLLKRYGKEEMIQQAIWNCELRSRGPWQKDFPTRVRHFTCIVDLKGLNRSHMSPSLVPVGQQVTRLLQDNYAGIGKNILVVRAPYIFRFVWNIFKHFIDPHVKDLIEIATEKETEELLAKHMDVSIMPEEIVPGKGRGKAVSGYEPVWEGGPLPPPAKNDWERRSPLAGLHNEVKEGGALPYPEGPPPPQETFATPQQESVATDTTSNNFVSGDIFPQTPIQPNKSTASISSVSSDSNWESLPSRTPRRNIQRAWTVTPAPIFDLDEVWKKENFNEMVKLWNMTQEEQVQMEELRDRLSDVHHWMNDPFQIARFYRDISSKGNIDKVEHRFRKTVTRRVEHSIDGFLRNFGQPHPLFHHVPACILRGTDRDGDPILFQRVGVCDYKSLLKRFGEDALLNYVLFLRELNSSRRFWKPREEESGRRFKQYTVIIDLDGVNAGHFKPRMLQLLRRVIKMFHDYYGGYAKRVLLIRPTVTFKFSWSLIKNMFDSNTRDKIHISGADYLTFLDAYVEREKLPPVVCSREGAGSAMPGYYENIDLSGGRIPKSELNKSEDLFPQPIPVFSPSQEDLSPCFQSVPMPPGMDDSDPLGTPLGTPVQGRNILMGYFEENADGVKKEASIQAFPSPGKVQPVFSSPMFKYNW